MNRFQAIDPKLMGLAPGDRLLDVGCGIGRHVLEMTGSAGTHIGIDWTRNDLLKAAYWCQLMRLEGRVRGTVAFFQGDATRLPFSDGSFDRVMCSEVLEHMASDRPVMAELVRVLRPGGVLVVSVPDEVAERLFWGLSAQYRNIPGGHVRIYRRLGLVRMLKENGIRPYAVRFRHSLEALFWLVGLLNTKDLRREGPVTRKINESLDGITPKMAALLERIDAVGNYLFPKSVVLYGRKPEPARR